MAIHIVLENIQFIQNFKYIKVEQDDHFCVFKFCGYMYIYILILTAYMYFFPLMIGSLVYHLILGFISAAVFLLLLSLYLPIFCFPYVTLVFELHI